MLFGTFIHILTSLIRDFCTSDRNFASTFFQIPPRDGHPWSWLVVGHCDYNPHNRLSLSRYMPCPAYQKIEGIILRLLLYSTLISLASIEYFLQPAFHSSQQLLYNYAKVLVLIHYKFRPNDLPNPLLLSLVVL